MREIHHSTTPPFRNLINPSPRRGRWLRAVASRRKGSHRENEKSKTGVKTLPILNKEYAENPPLNPPAPLPLAGGTPPFKGGDLSGRRKGLNKTIKNKKENHSLPEKSQEIIIFNSLTVIRESPPMKKLHNRAYLKPYRKKLRNSMTVAEARLWNQLKKQQLEGRKFRRQHSIGKYIVDFYCPSEKLIIELDGSIHDNYLIYQKDIKRRKYLEDLGYTLLVFSNIEIRDQLDHVLAVIRYRFKDHSG